MKNWNVSDMKEEVEPREGCAAVISKIQSQTKMRVNGNSSPLAIIVIER